MKLYLDDPVKRGHLDAGRSACGQYRKFGHAYKPRVNAGGNYCGHDPANPKLTLEKPAKRGKGGHPSVMARFQERVIGFYWLPQSLLPSLNAANRSATGRQMRSEAREVLVVLLQMLIQYTCFASMRVGVPTEDGFLNFTVAFFIKKTGFSESRVKRAFRYLEVGGLISVTERAELQTDGTYRGVAAIRCVNPSLFKALGLWEHLKYTRKKRSDALKAEAEKLRKREQDKPLSTTAEGRRGLMMQSLGNILKNGSKRRQRAKTEDDKLRDMEIKKQVVYRVSQLYEQHPDWSRDKLYEVAEKQIIG